MAVGTLILGILTKNIGSSDTASVITQPPPPAEDDDGNPWADVW
jgi:hypothetical protein